ncbi:transcriptional regulator [Rivularia sp. PCC 7116]|uniref:TetR/AcrR family transcriptional regulator n=1 Tax=Rivularia sp. PCC 7116 TaxID=373994 RepID=UPI00029EC456|nr:TetR/AcrR family transcriptional regulator [Rivularia sp. PCC 7116]AFY56895.1 transcriptional regulator [Rivularia sp. PCC 7116]
MHLIMATVVEHRETKQKLLEKALDLIWENNYDCVGIVQICTQAGVTKGAFYHYFKSKSDLAAAALEARWLKVRNSFDRVFSPQNTSLERVDFYCELIISMQAAKHAQTGRVLGCPFISTGQSTSEDKLRSISVEITERMTKYFTSLVADAQREGIVDKDLNPINIARYMYVFVQGVLTIGRLKNDLESVKTDLKPGLLRILGVSE